MRRQAFGSWAPERRILPTTTQLPPKSGLLRHFHHGRDWVWHLANNNVLVWSAVLLDKGVQTMLNSDQINELHRLYWSERWTIRKIEHHLKISFRTIKKYLAA